jgi:hypothetical protein
MSSSKDSCGTVSDLALQGEIAGAYQMAHDAVADPNREASAGDEVASVAAATSVAAHRTERGEGLCHNYFAPKMAQSDGSPNCMQRELDRRFRPLGLPRRIVDQTDRRTRWVPCDMSCNA